MFADQNPRRLLLLCVRASRVESAARPELRGDGPRYDRRHLVSYRSKVLALSKTLSILRKSTEKLESSLDWKSIPPRRDKRKGWSIHPFSAEKDPKLRFGTLPREWIERM